MPPFKNTGKCMLIELNSFEFKGKFLSTDFKSISFYNTAKGIKEKTHMKKRKRTLWVDNKINLRKKKMSSVLLDEKSYYMCHICIMFCVCADICVFSLIYYSITSIRRVSVAIIFNF